jgi:hypothetical protein
VLKFGARDKFDSAVYYITLNPICVAEIVFKNLKRRGKDRVRSQN